MPTLTARLWKRTRPIPTAESTTPTDPARQQLVSQIIEINPSATTAFLGAFENSALRTYLDHLHSAQIPRGRHATWVRPGDSPAIMCRERAD
jgi:hypothetical protein